MKNDSQFCLPGGILGNGKLLLAVSPKGELTKVFWPQIDWGQHLGIIKIGLKTPNQPTLWLDDSKFITSQSYLDDSNILKTTLSYAGNFEVELEDIVHPEKDILFRHYTITNLKAYEENIQLIVYAAFTINESKTKDSIYFDLKNKCLIQHKREVFIGLKAFSYPLSGFSCGRRNYPSDPFFNASKGQFGGIKDCIKNGAGSFGVNLGDFSSMESKKIKLTLVLAPNEEKLISNISLVEFTHEEESRDKHLVFWQGWLKKKILSEGESLEGEFPLYKRSLITLKLLSDRQDGGILASPEFDFDYEFSGGYGYCWARDGVFSALAFDEAGYHEEAKKFYYFMVKIQCKNGDWHQRYWLNGSWASHWGRQIDQNGAILWGYYHHYTLTKDLDFLKKIWRSVVLAMDFLENNFSTLNNLPLKSLDLWEDNFSQGTYTCASLWGGITGAIKIATILEEADYENKWQEIADKLKEAILKHLPFPRGFFTRSLGSEIIDSAVLGLCFPFGVLNAHDPLMEKSFKEIESHLLNCKTGGFYRYQWDQYMGGNPWVISTLWAAIFLSQKGDKAYASELIRWAENNASPTGLLPEQIDKEKGKPFWVLPLSWSCAMYILACLSLKDQLSC